MSKFVQTTVTIVDFDDLARRPDEEIIRRFVMACRMIKKGVLPKAMAGYSSRIERQPELLSIALVDVAEKRIGTFSFAPVRFR